MWHNYFLTYKNNFWQWEDNQTVISIRDSGTVIYRDRLLEILDLMRGQGWPPLGSLILVLAYLSRSQFISHQHIEGLIKRSGERRNLPMCRDAIAFLNIIRSMEPEYTEGKKRILLLMAIFSESHNILSPKKCDTLFKRFKTFIALESDASLSRELELTTERDLKPLYLLLRRFPDAESIKKKMATLQEIDWEEEEVKTPIKDSGDSDDLITEICSDARTSHSGKLIKRIWSSANIPMKHKVPSGQPFGGVADITNRGEFDKLLISEFANDETSFLSRLANREAMFFNREAPPAENNEDKIIIIDNSLNNWGTVRTISFAMMLAIVHHPKARVESKCFGVGRRSYVLSVGNIDEIIDSVMIIDTALSAQKGLVELFRENDFSKNEVFFISEKTSMADTELQNALAEFEYPIDYWIHPDKKGNIEIYKKYRSGRRHHQSFTLPLKKLWEENDVPTTKEPPTKPTRKDGIHLLISMPSPDFRLMISGGMVYAHTSGGLILKRALSQKPRRQYTWEILHENVRYQQKITGLGRNREGQLILLIIHRTQNTMTYLNLETKQSLDFPFPTVDYRWVDGILYEAYHFYMKRSGRLIQIDMEGRIEVMEGAQESLRQRFHSHVKNFQSQFKSHVGPGRVLKNIHSVVIKHRSLVLNGHVLFMPSRNDLMISERKSEISENDLKAKSFERGKFSFENGSTIEVHPGGVLILKSKNPEIPVIQILTMIQGGLAACTPEVFAGNERYYRETTYLHYRRSKVTSDDNSNLSRSDHIYTETLTQLGKSAYYDDVWVSKRVGLKKMSVDDFYRRYINKFIEEIVQHVI